MEVAVPHRESPSRRELARLYDATAGYWDSFIQRGVYGFAYTRLLRELRPQLWSAHVGDPIRVLDCGTGCGLLLISLVKAMDGRPMELFGIDLSAKMLGHAQRSLTAQRPSPKFCLADICSLPFRDGDMDLVMSALVLEHVVEPIAALREMRRVARPDARLILVTTRPHAPDIPYQFIFRYRHFQDGQILTWMEEAGIREVRLNPLAVIARWFGQAFVGRTGQ
jgi:ubiquinone/menaquinone biosynthesis C-methylase UbiE